MADVSIPQILEAITNLQEDCCNLNEMEQALLSDAKLLLARIQKYPLAYNYIRHNNQ